jgi:5'-deoxynucleotidase YfbR-like HD superfamily hydrolase
MRWQRTIGKHWNVKMTIPSRDRDYRMAYCTLAYCVPQECVRASVNDSNTLLLATLHDSGEMKILVNPDWRSFVQEQDSEYLEELLKSFIERVGEDPSTLFKQLASLSVGPLVTKYAGTKAYSDLLCDPQFGHFVKLN